MENYKERVAKIQEQLDKLGIKDFRLSLNWENLEHYSKNELINALCTAVEAFLKNDIERLEPVGDSNYNGSN